MRIKCEKRRQAILDVAEEIFREKGFELTSMSEITARVGGSKATLYSYFASKEELFLEVMHRFADADIKSLFNGLDSTDNMQTTLQRFGEHFLEFICQPQLIAAMRVLYAESGRTDVGRRFYDRGPLVGITKLGEYLSQCIELGKVRQHNTVVSAQQFLAILQAEIVDPLLFGIDHESLPSIQESVKHTVEMFLRAYAPEP